MRATADNQCMKICRIAVSCSVLKSTELSIKAGALNYSDKVNESSRRLSKFETRPLLNETKPPTKPVSEWSSVQMLDYEYHERIDTHGMALEHRTDIQQHNTMIHTMKMFACTCQPVPTDARREWGKSGS